MPAKVTLKISSGGMAGEAFLFDGRDSCFVGRSKECKVRVRDEVDPKVSRRHCLLDVNPPEIRIRDYGSLNGTRINRKLIGKRQKDQSPEEGAQFAEGEFSDHDLKHGDQLRLGDTVFQVKVYVPAVCAECEQEIADGQRQQAEVKPGVYQCAQCRAKAQAAQRKAVPKPKPKCCAKCGRDVSDEVAKERHGQYVCVSCKADPLEIIKRLLDLARSGRKELVTIEGYSIEKELGRGGMGAVYLARHERNGNRVALKIMLPQVAADRRATEMFGREVENTKALRHRHVVRMHDSGCSDGTFFFTIEFCEGGSVDDLMKARGGRLPVAEAGPLILQTLDGLIYAHQAEIPNVRMKDGSYRRGQGLVHRDLSPNNIFLTGSDGSRTAKVGDFGLSKAFDMAGLSGQTRTGTAAGKPIFMPRQQVLNFKYSKPEVDVWAAAACLYNMLTGAYPRDFRRGQDPWNAILKTQPVPIRKRNSSIPKPLADIVDQALQDHPKITFQTAAQLKRALERVL